MFNSQNSSSFSLKQRIAEKKIAALMATGKFTDTGKQYNAADAVADANNPALRMTATIDGNKLSWSK